MVLNGDGLSRLQKKDINKALDILSDAFENYAFPASLIKNPDKRRIFVREMLKFEVKYCLKRGNAYTLGGDFKEVSLWHDDAKPIPQKAYLPYFSLSSFRLLKIKSSELKAIQKTALYIDQVKMKLSLPENTTELAVVGVSPANQGEGRAAKMIRACLALLCKEKRNCLVITNTEKNKGIYTRLGFNPVFDDIDCNGIRIIMLLYKF